jgi:glucose/arabinose dehydrogenase
MAPASDALKQKGGYKPAAVLLAITVCAFGCARKHEDARDSALTAADRAQDLASATREKPLRPEQPSRILPVRNGPGSAPREMPKLDGLQLPPGFSIELYSDQVPDARSLALGARGTVFVSTRKNDRVYALIDDTGDHKVDRVRVVARELDTPNGIAYQNGSLYIAEVSRLLRIDDIDAHLDDPPRPIVVTDSLPDEGHHGWRYIRFGPDGWLYIPIGAPCNVCERKEPIFSSISRIRSDGTGLETFARGVRNSLGFDWHPDTRQLWFTENGRDQLAEDLPPDELNRVTRAGAHFGFPYCHAGVIIEPELGGGHSCTEFEAPVQNLGPHVAALGMRFYTGRMFPSQYRNAAIIAEHGSWNRKRKIGYRVMVVRLDGDRAVSYEPLLSGFLNEQSQEVSGRPVDVEVLEDGSLLVSDDFSGAVYRVRYDA